MNDTMFITTADHGKGGGGGGGGDSASYVNLHRLEYVGKNT